MDSSFARSPLSRRIILICISALLLVGCTKKAPDTTVSSIGTLQVWTTGPEVDFLTAVGLEFGTKSSGKAAIDIIEFPSEEVLHETLLDALAEQRGPDVIVTNDAWVTQNTKKLIPLTDDQTLTPTKFEQDFVRAARETLVKDDAIYGIPLGVETLGIYYNENHLINRLPDRDVPASTWQAFQSDVQRLTKADNSLDRFSVSGAALGRWDNITHPDFLLETLLSQFQTDFYTPEGAAADLMKQKIIDGENVRPAEIGLSFLTRFADVNYRQSSWNNIFPSDFDAFLAGDVSQVFGTARDYEKMVNMQKNTRGSIPLGVIQTAELPRVDENQPDILGRVITLAVPISADYAERTGTAWNFLKFMSSKERMTSAQEKLHLPTARLDLILESQSDPIYGPFVRQAKRAKSLNILVPRSNWNAAWKEAITAINQGASPKNALLIVQDEITLYRRNWLELQQKLTRE